MRKLVLLLFISFFMGTMAQDLEAIMKGEREAYIGKQSFVNKRSGQEYDILYHRIHLNIDPSVRYITGSVYSELKAEEDNFSIFSFDLDSRMQVDSVVQNGNLIGYVHQNDEVIITSSPVSEGEVIAVTVYYQGNPSVNEQKGFTYDFQINGPIAWTLSEPYGAYGWWPNKQQLEDKVDSVDILVHVPKGNKVGSLGLITSVDTLSDSSLIFTWKHRYPVASYLVAVAVSNYEEINHYIHLSNGDSLLHMDLIYPAYREESDTLRGNVDGMIQLFDSLFGPYPFMKEKYGHVMFGRGGGMEHQTMSFMATLNFDLMAHELGHQWFGDKITCGSWQHLWLNEGWATYTNALAREFIWGKSSFYDFLLDSRDRSTRENDGSVYAYDTTNVDVLFDADMRYRKGSMVLHQLRWEIGDSAFFAGAKNYMANAELCYGFAYTDDLQKAMEEASGQDLNDYFERYVYMQGFPQLVNRWHRVSNKKIVLEIQQSTSHPSVEFFPLKIEYHAIGEDRDSTFIVEHTVADQTLELDLGFKVKEIRYDPNIWLISKGTVIEGNHIDLSAVSIYPNPAQQEVNIYLNDKKVDRIQLLDIHGRVVYDEETQTLKGAINTVSIAGLAGGVYIVKAYSEGSVVVGKINKSVF